VISVVNNIIFELPSSYIHCYNHLNRTLLIEKKKDIFGESCIKLVRSSSGPFRPFALSILVIAFLSGHSSSSQKRSWIACCF